MLKENAIRFCCKKVMKVVWNVQFKTSVIAMLGLYRWVAINVT